jgi:hemolysin activation/secretion protein
VTPVLKPGTVPGRVDVDLKVDDKPPLHGNFELNNRKTGNTTDLRFSGNLRYDNLWQRQHSLGLQYQTSPENTSEVSVMSLNYLMPVRGTQDMLALYAVNSDSAVAASSTVGVLGKGVIGGLRWIRSLPSPATDAFAHSLTLGADYKHFREITQLLGSDSLRTPIKYVPMSTAYAATLQDATGQTQFNAGFNFLIRNLFGLNQDRDFENKRFKAQANYGYLRADIQRSQTLPRGYSLMAKFEMQRASGPLISNEQYGAGGVDSVRGYLEYERFGDNAFLGKFELRTPSIWGGADSDGDFYALAFVEAASLHILEPLPGNAQSYNLSSAGAAIRVKARGNFQAMLDVGHPFRNGAYTPAGGVRVNVRTMVAF